MKKALFILPLLALLITGCDPEKEVYTSKTSTPDSSLSVSNDSENSDSSESKENSESNSTSGDTTSESGSYVELPFI